MKDQIKKNVAEIKEQVECSNKSLAPVDCRLTFVHGPVTGDSIVMLHHGSSIHHAARYKFNAGYKRDCKLALAFVLIVTESAIRKELVAPCI